MDGAGKTFHPHRLVRMCVAHIGCRTSVPKKAATAQCLTSLYIIHEDLGKFDVCSVKKVHTTQIKQIKQG